MLAIMLEKSASMTQPNTRVYDILETHSLTSAFSQRLRKYTFTAVHTKTHKRRFQIYPLWRAFSNLCVYGERFHRLRVDGRPKRIKKFAFTSVGVYNRLRVDGASVYLDATKTVNAPYCQGNVTVFGENAEQQCVAMIESGHFNLQ